MDSSFKFRGILRFVLLVAMHTNGSQILDLAGGVVTYRDIVTNRTIHNQQPVMKKAAYLHNKNIVFTKADLEHQKRASEDDRFDTR